MKSFKDLKIEELRRSAVEDFAVEIGEKDGKDIIIAALVESGVSWSDYVAQHPEVAPIEETPVAVVTSKTVTSTETIAPVPTEEIVVRVKEEVVSAPTDKFLIKMVRENLMYETRGHRFTKQHPYALVSPADAQYILSKEDGFRQAFPDELQEFYS